MEIIVKSKRYGDQICLIDYEDFKLIDGLCMHLKKTKRTLYVKVGKNKNFKYIHRIIMNNPIGLQVDHKNHNGLDNRKVNLRVATQIQNIHNTAVKCTNKSGFKGVKWVPKTSTWDVTIRCGNKTYFGGAFKCKINAAIKYNEMALKHNGEFAFLNTITEDQLKSKLDECLPMSNHNRSNTTGFRGVYALRNSKKWQAQIIVNRKPIYGGLFDTKEEAAKRYNELAILHHKDKAILNKI